jgi:hypothetical protein
VSAPAFVPPARRGLVLLAALTVLFAVLGVRYAVKTMHDRSAFNRWRGQILQLDVENISAKYNYPNPPIMAVLLEPLARLPSAAGALVWFSLKAAMAVLALFWVFRLVEEGGPPFPPWARWLVVLCALKPIIDDLNHGNVNLFILFLVVAFLTAYRGRRDLLAGGVLGLAVACKLTPALFVPYLVWKRAWRTLAGFAAGVVLFFYPGLVPALRLGPAENQAQLASWYDGMVKPFLIDGKVTSEHVNQSLPGLVFRLATHSPSFVTFVHDVETPARYDNLLTLPPAAAKRLVQACMAAWVLLFVWCCRGPLDGDPTCAAPDGPGRRGGWRAAAEMSLVVLGMLLFSERTWKHHCVTLVLPFAVLCYYLAARRPGPVLRDVLAAVVALALVLTTLTGLGPSRERETAGLAPGFAKMALVYGAYTFACLTLLAGQVVVLRVRRGSGFGDKVTR